MCDKAELGLGLGLGSRIGSDLGLVLGSQNNRKIIVLTWQDLILGCNYKTKGKERK